MKTSTILAATTFAASAYCQDASTRNFTIQISDSTKCTLNGQYILGYHLYAGKSIMVAAPVNESGHSGGAHIFSITSDESLGKTMLFDSDIAYEFELPCEFSVINPGDNAAAMYCGAIFENGTGNYYDASGSAKALRMADIESYWICSVVIDHYGDSLEIDGVVVGLIGGEAPTSSNMTDCKAIDDLQFAAPTPPFTLFDQAASNGCSSAGLSTSTKESSTSSQLNTPVTILTTPISTSIAYSTIIDTPVKPSSTSVSTSVTTVSPTTPVANPITHSVTSVATSMIFSTPMTHPSTAISTVSAMSTPVIGSATASVALYTGAAAGRAEATGVIMLAAFAAAGMIF